MKPSFTVLKSSDFFQNNNTTYATLWRLTRRKKSLRQNTNLVYLNADKNPKSKSNFAVNLAPEYRFVKFKTASPSKIKRPNTKSAPVNLTESRFANLPNFKVGASEIYAERLQLVRQVPPEPEPPYPRQTDWLKPLKTVPTPVVCQVCSSHPF